MGRNSFIFLTYVAFVLQYALGEKITCPKFKCVEPNPEGPIRQDMCL